MIGRIAAFVYGVACYALFLFTAVVAAAFIGNFGLESTMDGTPRVAIGWAMLVNVVLLTVFALQHSVMARPAFKRWWTQFVPKPVERSTYVLFSNLAILALCWYWEPIGGTVWHVGNPMLRTLIYVVYAAGWIGVVSTTFLINHFDLFGLRQVWLYLKGEPYTVLPFRTPGPYRIVRHPLYIGWLTVFWAAPTMTVSHLVFALATTAYILIAIQFEERDLEEHFGASYTNYKETVPMLVPVGNRRQPSPEAVTL